MTITAFALASEAAIIAHGAAENDSVVPALISLAVISGLVAVGAFGVRLTAQKEDDATKPGLTRFQRRIAGRNCP